MPDKKVSKSSTSRPITPSQKLESSLSAGGTVNMAESAHDKARAALVDKFREREERWRREQSLHEQQGETGRGAEAAADETSESAEGAAPAEPHTPKKGGAL